MGASYGEQGTVELTARVRGHFVMLIQGNMQLIERDPGHILVSSLLRWHGFFFQ